MGLADAMTMGPAIVPRVRFVVDFARPPNVPAGVPGVAVPPPRATVSTNVLLAAVSVPMVAVRAKLATVSCCRTTVSFVAASARLSSAFSN